MMPSNPDTLQTYMGDNDLEYVLGTIGGHEKTLKDTLSHVRWYGHNARDDK